MVLCYAKYCRAVDRCRIRKLLFWAILDSFAQALEQARSAQASLALAMIDIDHFKRINDMHGHLAGDEVLCHCVRQLQQQLRPQDQLGRYGGEEFLVLLPGVPLAQALDTLQRMGEAIAANPAHCAGREIGLRFSAGLWCAVSGPADTAASVVAQADAALYQAGAGGRNAMRLVALAGAG